MNPQEIESELIAYTVEHNRQPKRDYLGMSGLGKCLAAQYFTFKYGERHPASEHLRFDMGLVIERDIKGKLADMGMLLPNSDKIVFVAGFDGRLKGHPDGIIKWRGELALLEIKKTVSIDITNIKEEGMSKRHQFQIQTYLKFSDMPFAISIYKASDLGRIYVTRAEHDPRIQAIAIERARAVLSAIDAGVAPACECGHCEENARRKGWAQ